jgi:hypothetical protein
MATPGLGFAVKEMSAENNMKNKENTKSPSDSCFDESPPGSRLWPAVSARLSAVFHNVSLW